MADTPDLGSGVREGVGVRISPAVPKREIRHDVVGIWIRDVDDDGRYDLVLPRLPILDHV